MSDSQSNMSRPARYRICVSGSVPQDWSWRLLGMTVSTDATRGQTRSTLEGELPDQSALAGVLKMIHEAHYAVLSVICLDAITDVTAASAVTAPPAHAPSLDSNQGT